MQNHIMGYHEYQVKWRPSYNEELEARREPENMKDAFAVCVLRNEETVGHLKKGDNAGLPGLFSTFCAPMQVTDAVQS